MFEYFRVGKPILAITPEDGAVAELIAYTQSGWVADETNISKIKAIIKENFLTWKTQKTNIKPKNIKEFERKNLTKKLSEILNKAIGNE